MSSAGRQGNGRARILTEGYRSNLSVGPGQNLPEDKENVPGAIALIKELTRWSKDGRSSISFVSGSPTQMRRVLEQKFELDGIRPDHFVLKPTLRNLLLGRFRAIRGQVGYKLQALLKQRANGPGVPEFLFGDDAEMDAFIYSMYADIIAGDLELDELLEILDEAEVYAQAISKIMDYVTAIEHRPDVQRIFIHLAVFWHLDPDLCRSTTISRPRWSSTT